MLRILAGAALALALAAPMAAAQTVALGGADLELGAPQTDVVAVIEERFVIVPSQLEGSYILYRQRASGAAEGVPLGTVTFAQGRLVAIKRYLGSLVGPEAAAAVRALLSSVAAGTDPGGEIQVVSDATADAVTTRLLLQLADRQITATIYKSLVGRETVSVELADYFIWEGSY